MKNKLYFLAVIIAATIFVYSCDEASQPDTETQTAIDNARAEEAVSQIYSTVNHYGINEEGIKSGLSDTTCPIITVDTSISFPRTLFVDFGETGCVGPDGVTRKGLLKITYSGHWYDPEANTTASVELVDYYVNSVGLEGIFSITYNGENSYGGPSFTIESDSAKLTLVSGSEITWSSTETINWVEGFDDFIYENDVILITGSSSGVNSEGRAYESEITTELRKEMSCDYIVSGIYELTPEGLAKRSVDFGDGECDDEATVTVNNVTLDITL
ncbi:MAG TPA: hypothetical protein DDX39_07345 [Bacteroidales bacterium]|nr:MAG: hypothetical protein A2W98_04290 [Bacteroidetes bacterium GWF2_33_38]OFY91526.1 MAG: hypothetical protein A2236_01155 [Bacteroidetes bacterium RIFOXYA2_FULL_33_7]HBF88439.1 hypothetical protein [Bacteroidales bacterium]